MPSRLSLTALPGLGEVSAGDDLAALVAQAIDAQAMVPVSHDVLVVAQKIVSKAEGRLVALADVTPSPRALELAQKAQKDARVVELVLRESEQVLRCVPGVIIVAHRGGHVMANAGIDRSNIGVADPDEHVLLLPEDADASARALLVSLQTRYGVPLAVVVSDSFGRAWRNGVVNVALGVAGLPALVDARGRCDRDGRPMQVTQVALADAIAAAAGLVMGECDEGSPVVLVRGAQWDTAATDACNGVAPLLRAREQDLFR